jgi:hypothetical protein
MDVDAIATAIATRYGPGLMTPPSGQGPVRSATANLPQQVTATPAVLVFPDSGSFDYSPSKRAANVQFKLQFLYSMGVDMPRDSAGIRKWIGVLVDQLKGAAQLGASVSSARVMAWRTVKVTYGGEEFNGVELDVDVQTSEAWSPTP